MSFSDDAGEYVSKTFQVLFHSEGITGELTKMSLQIVGIRIYRTRFVLCCPMLHNPMIFGVDVVMTTHLIN